jgi:hypothetical protein
VLVEFLKIELNQLKGLIFEQLIKQNKFKAHKNIAMSWNEYYKPNMQLFCFKAQEKII